MKYPGVGLHTLLTSINAQNVMDIRGSEMNIKEARKSLKAALHSLKFNGYQKWLNHNPNDAAEDHIKDALEQLR